MQTDTNNVTDPISFEDVILGSSNTNNPSNPIEPINPVVPSVLEPIAPVEPITVSEYDKTLNLLTTDDNNLSEDDKTIKSSLFELVKGTKLNSNGDIINANGEVVLTATALKTYIETDTLPLSEKGEVVNSKGEVLKTAEQLALENNVTLYTKNVLETNFGVKLPEDFEVEDNEEGLVKITDAIIKEKSKKSVQEFLDSNSIVKDFYNHLLLGGKPNDFNIDVTNYDIDSKTLPLQQKLSYIDLALTKQGVKDTSNLIKLYESASPEIVEVELKKALTFLKERQVLDSKEKTAKVQEALIAEQKEIEQYWNNVNKVVDAGKIANISIPLAEKEGFKKYLSSPVKDGKSQEMLDEETEPIDVSLMVSYLRYKKYDLSKLVTNLANNQKVLSLKERFKKNTNYSSSHSQHNSSSKDNVISLDTII